jgi:2-polyprenyl-3-methyl-5-hydroxy-6-metoxy-1,4-benzoquinol methylase
MDASLMRPFIPNLICERGFLMRFTVMVLISSIKTILLKKVASKKEREQVKKGVLEQRKYEQINSLFNNKVSLLDVGCSGGTFLEVCKDKG